MAVHSIQLTILNFCFPFLNRSSGKDWEDLLESPIPYFQKDQLKEKFYPFVDAFGQYMFADWPNKIHSVTDLEMYGKNEDQDLSEHPGCPEWNDYGGWANGPQLKATGRFRVEKYKRKWWFVDPTGNLFWSQD